MEGLGRIIDKLQTWRISKPPMTVQELIDYLQNVKDKSIPIMITAHPDGIDSDYYSYSTGIEPDSIKEFAEGLLINI